MPLTDPELDLLQELLEDDPEDDVFLQVGEELNRRARWGESYAVLRRGLQVHQDEAEGWALLARAALEVGEYRNCLSAWERAGVTYQSDPDMGRVRILALERSGRTGEAKEAIEAFELDHGMGDVVIDAAKERLDAPPPDRNQSARDPFLTVAHAERYAALGRTDRAIRIYRRILFRFPDDLALKSRLDQLRNYDFEADDFTDLSEELVDPTSVPPQLVMPEPGITSASVEPAPQRGERPVPSASKPAGLEAFMSSSRAAQRRGKAPSPRRKRRSLLKR